MMLKIQKYFKLIKVILNNKIIQMKDGYNRNQLIMIITVILLNSIQIKADPISYFYNKRIMDSDVALSFLQYSPECQEYRNKFLKRKNIQEIKTTSSKLMELEFDVLGQVQIPEHIFYLKNKKMNRYIDILAYQHSRVHLEQIPNYYINANIIKSLVDGAPFAIFSQAPVKSYDNFWEAAYYKNVTIVVMLCSFYDPKRGHQSQQYWPNPGQEAKFSNGQLKVKNLSSDSSDQQYIVTNFQIEGPKGVSKLTHIHWMGWSDLKKPVESNMNRFEQILEICLSEIEKKNLIWVHCSAGIGRTGTLGGVIEAIRMHKKNGSISIFEIVQNLRRYRYHAVQTFEQYKFLYQYLSKKLT